LFLTTIPEQLNHETWKNTTVHIQTDLSKQHTKTLKKKKPMIRQRTDKA